MKKKVAWEKWVDPLNGNLNEVEWPGHEPRVSPDNIEYYDFSENSIAVKEGNIDEDFFKNLGNKIHSSNPLRVVNTRLGMLTATENALAANAFDFWTLHTNFPITEAVAEKLIKAPGVDAFMAVSRYRCRLGFPRSGLFNITEVKLDIQKMLTEEVAVEVEQLVQHNFTDEVQVKIDDKINELKQRSKHWALYVLPNGGMEILESDEINSSYRSKLSVFEASQKLVNGRVFQS